MVNFYDVINLWAVRRTHVPCRFSERRSNLTLSRRSVFDIFLFFYIPIISFLVLVFVISIWITTITNRVDFNDIRSFIVLFRVAFIVPFSDYGSCPHCQCANSECTRSVQGTEQGTDQNVWSACRRRLHHRQLLKKRRLKGKVVCVFFFFVYHIFMWYFLFRFFFHSCCMCCCLSFHFTSVFVCVCVFFFFVSWVVFMV